jgi:hypothetical protein
MNRTFKKKYEELILSKNNDNFIYSKWPPTAFKNTLHSLTEVLLITNNNERLCQ